MDSLGCPQTRSPPASASQVLGFQECATTASSQTYSLWFNHFSPNNSMFSQWKAKRLVCLRWQILTSLAGVHTSHKVTLTLVIMEQSFI
jgi:hypothetical protein